MKIRREDRDNCIGPKKECSRRITGRMLAYPSGIPEWADPFFIKISSVPMMQLQRKIMSVVLGPIALTSILLLVGGSMRGQSTPPQNFTELAASAASNRDNGNTDTAVQQYRQALQMQPDWAEGWWNLGSLYYAENQYIPASDAFQKLASLRPQVGVVWSMLGLCEFETRNYAKALQDLETGQQLGSIPDEQLAQVAGYHLALLQNQSGDFPSATQTIRSAFGDGGIPDAAKEILGLALLHIPLFPDNVDPARDALVQAAGNLGALLNQGRTTEAVAAFPALLAQYPKIPYLHLAYANALISLGQLRPALRAIQEEEALSPQASLPWVAESQVDLLLHHNTQALAAARKAVALDPQSPTARKMLVQALVSHGEIAAAQKQKALWKSLPREPSHPEARILSLYTAQGNGSAPSAVDPASALQQATQEYQTGNYAAAASHLRLWLSTHTQDGTAWAILGLCEYATHDYENARIHLQRGRDLGMHGSPASIQDALYHLAILLNLHRQFDDVPDVLTPVLDAPSPSKDMLMALGISLLHISKLPNQVPAASLPMITRCGQVLVLQHRREFDAAVQQLQSLTQQYPNVPFLHFAYGKALASLALYDKATAEMLRETHISPHSELPWIWLARIALTQQDAQAALPDAERAVSLAPDSAEAQYMLGDAELQQGQIPAAIRTLQNSVRLLPNSPETHFALAQAYLKAHQPQKAAQERTIFQTLRNASPGAATTQPQ